MSMGSTSRVVLNDEMQKAKAVCANYRTAVASLVGELDSTISTLFSSGFQGEAADGFKEFYDKNIKDFFESAEGVFNKFMSMFDMEGTGLFDSIESALILTNGLDPTLGENNRTVGQGEGQAAN